MATAALAALGFTAPQASAAETASVVDLVAPQADEETRRIAAEDPQAVQAAATLCGSGYELSDADQLPETDWRLGTLFLYLKAGAGSSWRGCQIFDNNTGSTKYMKLKVCDNKTDNPPCDTDEGNFSQYAGPVYTGTQWKYPQCARVTAIMKNSQSSGTALIDAVRVAGSCN
ncbi:hypothetical protein ACFV1F_21270 [Streptomyces sp. NPDC059590]|uniref:hypothetical protein n=1 Tax=unclassified Streptomyces TaxID=2593676 RepID=UPI003683D0F2